MQLSRAAEGMGRSAHSARAAQPTRGLKGGEYLRAFRLKLDGVRLEVAVCVDDVLPGVQHSVEE